MVTCTLAYTCILIIEHVEHIERLSKLSMQLIHIGLVTAHFWLKLALAT